MERCDFSSVSSILLRHARQGAAYKQETYIENLFNSVINHTSLKKGKINKATVSKWLSGTLRVNSDITEYYQREKRRNDMMEDIENLILPRIADPGLLVQELYDLVFQDADISEETKNDLCKGSPWKEPGEKAAFIRDLICFGMERRFIKRDAHFKASLAADQISPTVANYIFDEGVPGPCRHFCGRKREISLLHELLCREGKAFIHGIPGIGKSELAKAYARTHKQDYTNILYLSYSGSLKKDITDLPFADDRPTDSDTDRFRKHNRFLRTLKSDTLIIIDNFDTLPADDNFLPVVLKYRCRILFTTRSIFSEYAGIELMEIEDTEDLFHLVSCFYPEAENFRSLIMEILEVIHRHTMCTELVARLLAKGLLMPDQVLERLKKEHASFSSSDRISISKDGRNTRKTYYDHIRTLFSLFRLTGIQMDILRNLSLIPLKGIHARLFARWMDFQDLNDLNDLIEMGLVKERDEFKVSLHPMIREVVISNLPPGICSCRTLLKSIQAECLRHGEFIPYHTLMFYVIENTISTAIKDDESFYLQLLEDVFPYMDTYAYTEGMQQVADEIEKILQSRPSDPKDHAILLLYRARLSTDSGKAVSYILEALRLLPQTDAGNAALTGNLHSSLGDLYRLRKEYLPARQHMDKALSIFHRFGLEDTHDFITVYINYSNFLLQTGSPMEALDNLLRLERRMEDNDFYSVDYMLLEETLLYACLSLQNVKKARLTGSRLLQLYDVFYENAPEAAAAKKAMVTEAFQKARLRLE